MFFQGKVLSGLFDLEAKLFLHKRHLRLFSLVSGRHFDTHGQICPSKKRLSDANDQLELSSKNKDSRKLL